MTDLRERVEEERGLLKRIQLHIPGFAGYRRREDIRAADNILRIQMANMLKEARVAAEEAREELTQGGEFRNIDTLGRLINRFMSLEGKVRHAEGGYSGISATIRIEEPKLERLYEYDVSLVDDVVAVGQEAAALKASAGEDGEKVTERVKAMRSLLDSFEDTFKRRMLVISRTEVVE